MSNFTDFEAFSLVPGTERTYQLEAPLSWEIGAKGSGWILEMPKGMTFDISVPAWLRWLLSPHDRAVLLAAGVHDELLRKGHDAAFASAEFRRAIIARGKSLVWSWLLFFATLFWTAFRRVVLRRKI